jgi:hypothetical protein
MSWKRDNGDEPVGDFWKILPDEDGEFCPKRFDNLLFRSLKLN